LEKPRTNSKWKENLFGIGIEFFLFLTAGMLFRILPKNLQLPFPHLVHEEVTLMNLRKTIFAVLMGLLIALPAAASEKPIAKMDLETFFQMNPIHGPAFTGRDYFEGFEGGTMPPAGWTVGVVNPTYTWTAGSASTPAGSLEGLYMAYCPWNTPTYQDETMSFDQYVDVAGGEYVLSFFMAGALGTSWDFNVAETVEVNGTTVFDFDSSVTQYFVWEKFYVDLSAYDGQTVTITFRYMGQDGDVHLVDAVMVDSGMGWEPPPPPEPPLNDTVQGALDNGFEIPPGAYSLIGENTYSNSDYPLDFGSCTGYSFSGADVVYFVCLDEGDVLDVVMENDGFDASIYLMTDPEDPFGSCVIGADDPETFSYTAEADAVYYLVVGAYASGLGSFEVTGFNSGDGCVVATESTTFDSLKSMYR
jgi:hypothetical protein